MIVECPACNTNFPVDPLKIPAGGVKARCSVCDEVFLVSVAEPETEAPPSLGLEGPEQEPFEDAKSTVEGAESAPEVAEVDATEDSSAFGGEEAPDFEEEAETVVDEVSGGPEQEMGVVEEEAEVAIEEPEGAF